MGFSQAGNAIVKPISLGVSLGTRTGGLYARDVYIQNGYVEFDPNSTEPFVCKRPALSTAFTFGAVTLTAGQGLFNFQLPGQLALFAIGNNTLFRLTGGAIPFGSASVNTWITTSAPSPPIPLTFRQSASLIVFKNQMMQIGGRISAGFSYLATVTASYDGIRWNTITNTAQWGAASTAGGRANPNLAVLDDTLYLMGGNNGDTQGVVFNDCWKTSNGIDWVLATNDMGVANEIYPRILSTTVTFKNNIVMIGGSIQNPANVFTTTSEVISSADGAKWSKNRTADFSPRETTAVVFKDAIFCIGGKFPNTFPVSPTYFAQVWRSSNGNDWTQVYVSGFTTEILFGSAVVLGDKIYAFAWERTGGFNSNQVYSSPDGAVWTLLSTPPWGAVNGNNHVVFKPPLNYPSYPTYPQDVIWTIEGTVNATYFSALDTNYATSLAIPSSAAVTEQYQKTEMNLGRYLVLKNTTDAHFYTSNSVNRIVDANYPGSTVRGLAVLNNRAYVMDTLGNIRGSELHNPTVWPGLDYIRADFVGDNPVCLARVQNYLIAFKVSSTMFFQSNGRAVGNTVSPVLNANMMVGCGSAMSVVEMGNTVFWVSTYGGLRRSVSMLNGLSPMKVSTDDVDRILDANPFADINAFSLKTGGQELYALTLNSAPAITLVYNKSSEKWSYWSSATNGVSSGTLPFRAINRAGLGQITYMQDKLTNGVYGVIDTNYQDTDQAGTPSAITTVVQMPEEDMRTNQPKFCASIDLLGDKYETSNPVTVQYSDDDWITTSTWGDCDLALDRAQIYRGGSFRRRSHRFTHTANQPLRVSSFQLTMEPGDV